MTHSKYYLLTAYLLKSNKNEVTLTFDEVEKILGFELPMSAKTYAVNWSNTRTLALPISWLEAGYKSCRPDMSNGIVHFIRSDEVFETKKTEKRSKSNKRTYIIARMYAGRYLENNLGGECINLLSDDHGDNYIFVPKLGFISKEYDDTVEAVILTKFYASGVFEVLGISKVAEQVSYQRGPSQLQSYDLGKASIKEYVEKRNITYGGVPFVQIGGNSFYGADITFKTKEFLFPKNDLYISDRENVNYRLDDTDVVNLSDVRFSNQSLHSYITDEKNPEAFATIEKLINDSSVWDRNKKPAKVENDQIIDNHFNFMDIIRKDFDELAYSNLFAYIFKKEPEIFSKFCNKILNVKLDDGYQIYREKEDIDLWIEDKDDIIVIENKIKSGINGVSERHDFSNGGLVQSQLLKYRKYVEDNKGDKKSHYFLFVPNYNKLDLKHFEGSQYYTVIRYSEIYDFFRKQNGTDKYYGEFINALYKHTKDREVDYAEDMAIRFLRQIRRNSNNKS